MLILPFNLPVSNVYGELFGGPSFSSTGPFFNADLGPGASASFGTGYQIGGGIGVPVLPGLDVGITGLYTGSLSPTFTSTGGEQATGSAHAETFLVGATLFPFQITQTAVNSTLPSTAVNSTLPSSGMAVYEILFGEVQPYVDVGVGASVDTMGSLTGHDFGVPTGIGPGETLTNFAWQAGAGLQIGTGIPGLTASIGYDYLSLGKFSSTNTFDLFGGSTIVRPPFEANVSESVVKVGLTWQFGAPPPPPPQ